MQNKIPRERRKDTDSRMSVIDSLIQEILCIRASIEVLEARLRLLQEKYGKR
jgi:hypothetical protein